LEPSLLSFLLFVLVGFCAQMIDGALGMAYGVSSNTFLLSLGVPPVIASASVHAAEMFTTLVSGLSHLKFGNVDKSLVMRLLIPGIIGGVTGAYILTRVDGEVIKPYISAYLLIMGIVIIVKSNQKTIEKHFRTRFIIPLGLAGGFFDSIGGGGWGPIVTTTLLANGHHPRKCIGSVNFAEFFVTVSESITFFLTLGLLKNWMNIAGLILGGVVAAPFAAMLTSKLPTRWIMIGVGILIVILSIRTLVLTFI
jgi:uncharacterized protein